MMLPIILCAFYIALAKANDQNITCPVKCTCISGTLSCSKISEIPNLEMPNPFTSFLFSDCNMDKLQKFPLAYENATDILVTRCGLSDVAEDAFDNLKMLNTLVLSGNRLTEISKNALVAPINLQLLDLSDNRITNLTDEVFSSLPKLSTLVLDRNPIKFTENLFRNTNGLTMLTCNNCLLSIIPGNSLTKIRNLSKLELNENPFGVLQDKAFEAFEVQKSQLQELHLDNCSLSSISKMALNPFGNLTLLNLGHNKLELIPVGAFDNFMNSLKNLHLESNFLTSLDEKVALWSKLEEFKLGNNPWNCDCTISWMKSLNFEKFDKENVTCYSPHQLQGQNLHEVETNMSCPIQSSHYLVLGFGILAMVIGLPVTIFCVVRLCKSRSKGETTVKYSQVYGETVVNSSKQSLVA